MPQRDPQLFADRRARILEGALNVFSTRGFSAATNRDVAIEAGINSPGLIYHYFASKADLLRAVVERYAPPITLLTHDDELMAMPPEEALPRLGQAYMAMVQDARIGLCLRVLIGEALRSPAFAEILREIGPMRILRLITSYMERKMDEGRLRRVNPAIAARCFIAPMASYMLTKVLLGAPDDPGADADTIVRTCVDIFLRGLQPESAPVAESGP